MYAKKSHNQAKLIASSVGRSWIKIRNLICFQFISIFQQCQGQSTGGRGRFFIWVFLLTALFHKAIWLCAYKTEVRVGQMVLGINQAGYVGQCMCVCVYKSPPPWLKRHRSDPRTCRGLLDGRRLKTMTEMCNLRGERVWLGWRNLYERLSRSLLPYGPASRAICHDNGVPRILQLHLWDVQFRWPP